MNCFRNVTIDEINRLIDKASIVVSNRNKNKKEKLSMIRRLVDDDMKHSNA